MKNYWMNRAKRLAKVESIYERTITIGRYTLLQRVARLRTKIHQRELVVYTQFPNHNHPYTYDNVVPHCDWIREGMTVDLWEGGWDGDFVKRIS